MIETFHYDCRDDGGQHGNGAVIDTSHEPGMPAEAATSASQLRARVLSATATMTGEKSELESVNRCRQR